MSLSVDKLTEKTFDNFKKITPALVAAVLLTGMILFLPQKILEKMALHNLPSFWRQIIGIIFLLSIALICAIAASSMFSSIISKYKNKKFRKKQRDKLQKLSPKQMKIICDLLNSEEKVIRLDRNSGDTVYLLNSLFIHQPEQAFSFGWDNEMILKYVPQPWLLDLYNEKPELFR